MFSLISVWSICLGHEKAAIGALKRLATRKRLFLCLQVEEKGGENATWPYSTVKFLTTGGREYPPRGDCSYRLISGIRCRTRNA